MGRLPTGYKELEYIQSSGTQHIDTLFNPSINSRVVADIKIDAIPGSIRGLFGCRDHSSAVDTHMFVFWVKDGSTYRTDYFGTNVLISVGDALSRTVVDKNKNITKVDDIEVVNSAVSENRVCENTMHIFNVNPGSFYITAKLYSMKIYDNDNLVRDYIPCENPSGDIGLYDLVTNEYYANSGTGVFEGGAVVADTNTSVQQEKLRAIADAIREAEGSSEAIVANDFANRIRSLSVGGDGMSVTVEVSVESGATVTATNGDNVVTATSVDGTAILSLTQFGEWTIQSEKDGKTSESDIISIIGQYNITQVIKNGEIIYGGLATPLDEGKYRLASTQIGNYALFAGGEGPSSSSISSADSYNSTLAHSAATPLSTSRKNLSATTVGDYALFAGGVSGSTNTSVVDSYTSALAHNTTTSLSVARQSLSSTTIGNYALFGGGAPYTSAVDSYTGTLAHNTATSLSVARSFLAAATIGDYALFAGGLPSTNTSSNRVDSYTSTLAHNTATSLSVARKNLSATTVGDYALFAGGQLTGSTFAASSVVDSYSSTLASKTATPLSVSRINIASATVGEYALFAGGMVSSTVSDATDVVDIYNSTLTSITSNNQLSEKRSYIAGCAVGDYALFGGGYVKKASNIVEYYYI